MFDQPHELDQVDTISVGYITHLNDTPHNTQHKLPLGFPIPKGDTVTPYRERREAGEYKADNQTTAKPKRPRKRAATKRATKKT